jgi:hypothetical protein
MKINLKENKILYICIIFLFVFLALSRSLNSFFIDYYKDPKIQNNIKYNNKINKIDFKLNDIKFNKDSFYDKLEVKTENINKNIKDYTDYFLYDNSAFNLEYISSYFVYNVNALLISEDMYLFPG